jgi:hypothetical protein
LRRLVLILPVLVVASCLYDVNDVVSNAGSDAGNIGGDSAFDVTSEGWAGGAGGSTADAELDVSGDVGTDVVADAPADVTPDAKPDAGVIWKSCKTLDYTGTCFGGNTVLFYFTAACGGSNTCVVNDCSLKGGSCQDFGPGCNGGWGCTIALDSTQAENCPLWTQGKCRDNAVIKADPNDPSNCLYRTCGRETCTESGGVADCT